MLDVLKTTMFIVDPMIENYQENNDGHKQCMRIGKELFSQKFRKHNPKEMMSPSHTLQKDTINCGVLCCFYAQQICQGNLNYVNTFKYNHILTTLLIFKNNKTSYYFLEKQLDVSVNLLQFRRDIYKRLVGSCLIDRKK